MELRNLTTFIHVAELGGFTKAAEQLGYSQSTISFQIKQLEEELGCLLFERINHTITLTQRGHELVLYAHKILELADEFKENVLKLDFFKNSYISKSWNLGVEFNPIDATKGSAVEFIKKHLGNIHTSIGIGDYENDLTLITDSDIGVAVGNAVPTLKKVADFIVKPCEEGAIRDLIEKIENGTIKK